MWGHILGTYGGGAAHVDEIDVCVEFSAFAGLTPDFSNIGETGVDFSSLDHVTPDFSTFKCNE